jgi:hypothetical protein
MRSCGMCSSNLGARSKNVTQTRYQSHSAPKRSKLNPAEIEEASGESASGYCVGDTLLFASEAFAMPYCTGGTFKDGHLVCTSLDDNH